MSIDPLTSGQVISALLVLVRVAAICALVPVPGLRQAGPVAMVGVAGATTMLLSPLWPRVEVVESTGLAQVTGYVLSELSLGILIGLCINLYIEIFVGAAQVIGLQTGFTYASTVNPATEADSNVMQILLQLYAMLLFSSLGLHRLVIRALAESIQRLPPGAWFLGKGQMEQLGALFSEVWVAALRLALPLVGLLLVLELTLAVFGKICVQLQLLTVSFPVKTLATLGVLAVLAPAFASVGETQAAKLIDRCLVILTGSGL
jgi:flagellar biosynthetic protein FliR